MAENVETDLLYRIQIPFKQLGISYKPESMISINIESGTSKMNKNGPPEMGNKPDGAMTGGRRPEGGMLGGRKPGMVQERMEDMNQLLTPIKIKLKKVRLSVD
ncbi:MAG: hypothetical protein HC831_23350 [Chloroflexia bacterium]|nr:hypothetical protein [Chloroflexia bacterium]